MAWRWATASVIGTSHIQNGGELEDAYVVATFGNGGILAVVSDGAGSAEFGKYGAWIVCRFLSVRFREWVGADPDSLTDTVLAAWIDELRDRIAVIAARRATMPRQFAATLTMIVLMPNEAVTLQIGDSAIVGRKDNQWDVLCWPENGEYASSTYFVTDDPGPRLNINRHPRHHNAYALFSDGVGDLALSHLERAAHPRFFGPMFRPVDAVLGEGRIEELSVKLATYLAGPSVCERTDDDKTLVLISGA